MASSIEYQIADISWNICNFDEQIDIEKIKPIKSLFLFSKIKFCFWIIAFRSLKLKDPFHQTNNFKIDNEISWINLEQNAINFFQLNLWKASHKVCRFYTFQFCH
jgi:hypothetical protein